MAPRKRGRAPSRVGRLAGMAVPQAASTGCSTFLAREAFGRGASVAQALAGAHLAILAKAGIEQRFTGDDVRSPLRTDRERSSFRGEGDFGLPKSSHGTSVPAANGESAPRAALSNQAM